MNNNKAQTKKLVGLVIILAILATYMYYIRPSQEDLSAKRQELAQKEQQVTDLQNKIEELNQLKSEIPDTLPERQAILAKIPTTVDQDGLITDLSELAKNRGIELKNVGFALGKVDPDSGIGTITMSTSFSGNYSQLIALLSDMEKNLRKLKVKNISVQVVDVSRDLNAEVKFSLVIESYYQG